MSCPYIHKNVQVLYGVAPKPTKDLPKICMCGEAITYVEPVFFIQVKEHTDSRTFEPTGIQLSEEVAIMLSIDGRIVKDTGGN